MKELLDKLKIKYNDIKIYERALTHSSFAYENNVIDNERLEFLGDSVLGFLMTEHLYLKFDIDEGKMSKMKAKAISSDALYIYANHINLKKYIKLGKGEKNKGPNEAIISNSFEAFLGAIYLDKGIETTKNIFKKNILPYLKETLELKDYKSLLQELIQAGGKRKINYRVLKEFGPSHNKKFEVQVKLDKNIILGKGLGSSKKEAEQNAAKDAIGKVEYDNKKVIL